MKSFDIKKIVSRIHLPQRHEYRTISSKAHHDWMLMVILCFLLSLVSIGWNLYLFQELSTGSMHTEASVSDQVTGVVSKKNLEDTVAFFAKKQARLEDLKTQKPNTVDPSM